MTECPDCAGNISIPTDIMKGELCACSDCGESFEVYNLEPIQIRKAETVGEDWGQ